MPKSWLTVPDFARRALDARVQSGEALRIEGTAVEQCLGHALEAGLDVRARGLEAIATANRHRFEESIETSRQGLRLLVDQTPQLLAKTAEWRRRGSVLGGVHHRHAL